MPTRCYMVPHHQINDFRRKWAEDRAPFAGAGAMWFTPYIFDPNEPKHQETRLKRLAEIAAGTFARTNYLSRHYWLQWSDKRPPICVRCPNGLDWLVDSKSTNGEGWEVTGDAPIITCTPSILVPGYHGYLREGHFTDDIDGRGVNGVRERS